MTRFLTILALATAVISTACVVTPGPSSDVYYGSAYYDVSETDYVVDDYGYEQVAYCDGTVLFSGYFDTACDALISSEATYGNLTCTYTDAAFDTWTYVQAFDFLDGYIQEGCQYAAAASPLTAEDGAVTESKAKIDPKTQPNPQDGKLHAIVKGRVGAFHTTKNLGKSVTFEEWLKTSGKSFVRVRNASKPIQRKAQ